MGRIIPILERIERCLERRPDGCWHWTKSVMNGGYPQIRVGRPGNGPVWLVHRWAYQHYVGPIPDGLLVLHHCDNKRCSNPAHLYVGTAKDNARDAKDRGRLATTHAFGARHRKLTDDDVRAIRVDERPGYVVAFAYRISESHVSGIKSRVRKGHVPD